MEGQFDLASFDPTDLDAFPNSPAKIDGAAFVALEQRIPSSPIPQYLQRSYLTSPVKYKQEENGKIRQTILSVGHLQTVNRSEEMINVSVSIHCESGKVDLVLSTYMKNGTLWIYHLLLCHLREYNKGLVDRVGKVDPSRLPLASGNPFAKHHERKPRKRQYAMDPIDEWGEGGIQCDDYLSEYGANAVIIKVNEDDEDQKTLHELRLELPGPWKRGFLAESKIMEISPLRRLGHAKLLGVEVDGDNSSSPKRKYKLGHEILAKVVSKIFDGRGSFSSCFGQRDHSQWAQ
ncbi:hypothetical protein F5051DRAFT_482821 [Lentinula edodes]|nr:hypothetical protein F5051DRAFT_482821 [Lentinula edodes]